MEVFILINHIKNATVVLPTYFTSEQLAQEAADNFNKNNKNANCSPMKLMPDPKDDMDPDTDLYDWNLSDMGVID